VREQDAYANVVWPGVLDAHRLAGRDAAFATELGYGTLRWRGRHDAVLSACVDRPLTDVQPELLDVLRLGVHQLHEMRVAQHAALAQSVELARGVVGPRATGFANGVLRSVQRGGDARAWLTRLVADSRVPDREADPAGYLEVATSHPRWIVSALHDALGRSRPGRTWVDTEEELLADNRPGEVTLVARTVPRDTLVDRLRGQGVDAQPGRLSRCAVRVRAVSPGSLPEVATGAAGVQDEGSQVVALALADALLDGPDARWLDLCAGPGGKAALLAGQVAERGGRLTAVELHGHRAELVRTALRPLRGRHDVLTGDARTLDLPPDFDRVLVDAPCTGLGALRRRPESRWRRRPEELAALTLLQRQLLARALELVRVGGLVLYVTCSPHLAETDVVVDDALRGGAVALPLPGSTDGRLRLWPGRDGTDGMFAALLRRAT
jgi:16S rRNA (cytosine967-C5)-methyltransferase